MNFTNFCKKTQSNRPVADFFPFVKVEPMGPKSQFFRKRSLMNRASHGMRRESINPSLLSQGHVLKGKKDENDKNLSRFGFGIGGRLAFFKEVNSG